MLKIVHKVTGEAVEVVNGVRLFASMVDGNLIVAGVDVVTCQYVQCDWFADYKTSL